MSLLLIGLLFGSIIVGSSLSSYILVKSVNGAIAKNPELKSKYNTLLFIGLGLAVTIPLIWALVPVLVVFGVGDALPLANALFVGIGGSIATIAEPVLMALVIATAVKGISRNPESESAVRTNMFVTVGVATVPGLLFQVSALLMVL